MSQRSRRPKARSNRRAQRRRRPEPPRQDTEPDLLGDIADALAADHPIDLLAQVGSLLAVLDPRSRGPLQRDADSDVPTLDALVATFLDLEARETSALLAAIAGLGGDEVLRQRVQRELATREHALPRWLLELPRSTPAPRVVEVVHVLGDGDNILVGARLVDGAELTAVIYIDHNAGGVVKDGFVVPVPTDELVEQMLVVADDPDTEARDIAPADARARITEGIEHGALTHPPYESDSWPASRPLVEWITAMLPAGGTGYQRPEWGEAALAELTERFLRSPHGAGFDDPDHRGLLESLLWFGTDYGPGDPLGWSPTRVEILLLDWIPRKIVAEAEYLALAPDLLRAFIRFSHGERGIRPELTAETVGAVDEYEAEYQQLVRSPRPQGPLALLAAMGLPVGDGAWDGELPEPHEVMLDGLAGVVGGRQALTDLDTEPLPPEDFAWDPIPADVRERVGEVLDLVDGCCDALLDEEYRTACRRLLARAAAADPAIFRRRSRADTAAAAVCWVIGKANDLFDPRSEPYFPVKTLATHFGLGQGSFSQRSEPFLRAVGVNPHERYGTMELGSPDYLTSTHRAELVADRDRYRALGS
jgi:Domain of unknown function (DUF6398)